MMRPQLLVVLVLVTLTAVAARPLLAQVARRRAVAAGASPTAEDPLVAWVTSLRHDGPASTDRRRPEQVGAPPTGAPCGGMPTEPVRARIIDTEPPSDRLSELPPGPAGGLSPDRSGRLDELSSERPGRAAEPSSGRAAEPSSGRSSRAVADRTPEPRRPVRTPGSPDARRLAGESRSVGPPPRRDSRRPGGTPPPAVGGRRVGPRSAGAPAAGPESAPARPWWGALVAAPRRALLVTGVAAAAVGAVAGGPVAAFAAGAYGVLGARALLRRRVTRHGERARRRRLDQLCDLAADLRAGLPVGQAVALSTDGGSGGAQVRAAVQLADRTGAPLAELLERIDVDARAAERGLAAATAQAAGARATAWLLAALPLGGIGLGYGIGVDPVAVLLHTPVGGGCAALAILLQVAGLLWAERLTSIRRRDVG